MFYYFEGQVNLSQSPLVAIQPNNPIALLRALKGAAASCLLALAMHGSPATAAWLERMTGYSPNTVAEALQVLLELGLAQRRSRNGGFELAPGARALLSGSGELESDRDALAEGFGGGSEEAAVPSECAILPQTESESQEVAEMNPHTDSDSVLPEKPPNPPLEVSRVLRATLKLFGEPVHGPPERYPDVWLLLATIAEAYDRRDRLRNPARVVYTNLKNGSQPAVRYRENPQKYLPGAFLREIGLPEPEEKAGYGDWESEAVDERDAPQQALAPPNPALDLPASQDGRRSARQVWQSARAVLGGQMHSHTYIRMIAPLQLVHFEAENATFTFAAPDDYRREWLEQHCTRIFLQVLGGLCNREVEVEFNVWSDT